MAATVVQAQGWWPEGRLRSDGWSGFWRHLGGLLSAVRWPVRLSEPLRTERLALDGEGAEDAQDLRWLRMAVAGDDEAFRALVDRHHQKLLAVCGRLLGDREEAQDVVQETFLQAYRKASSLGPSTRVGGWLYRVAVNGCLKRLRRRRVVRFLSLTVSEPNASATQVFESADPAPRPDRRLEARERWRRTRRQIDALPPQQRVVLVLARFEGLSMRQVAETLGISERAVEGRLARALARLRDLGGAR